MNPGLVRSIGLRHATALVAGTIIGAAIFVQPSEIGRHVPSVSGILLVWLLAGLLTFCGAAVCAELASALPHTGGVYVYLKEGFSPALGFLWGWAMFWSMHSGIVAAIAVVFGRYLAYFLPLGDRAAAIVGILLLSGINYVGVKQGSVVQTVLTLVKVLAIALLVGMLLVFGASSTPIAPGASGPAWLSLREFILAVSAGLFAFGGWHMVTYPAGETRDPGRTIPQALALGTATVTLCYLALNAAYLHVLPLDQVISSPRIATDAANVVAGPRSAGLVTALVIVSTFGALSGIVLAGPRVYYAMALDGLMPRWAGALHPRYRTPHVAILLQAAWSCVLVATGTYRGLFTRVIYTEWLFFALMTIGVFRLRRRPGYAPSTRIGSVAPALFLVSSVVIVANQVAATPLDCALGLLLVAAGLPVYYWWCRSSTSTTTSTRPPT